MRIAVLDFLKSHDGTKQEKYNKALDLFSKTSANPNLVRAYNSRIFSDNNLECILYDLQKANAISEVDIRNHVVEVPGEENSIKDITPITPEKSAKERLEDKVNLDVFGNIIRSMSAEQKEGFTMAAKYPFLSEKDCPTELQALSTQAVNSFHAYRAAHEKLFEDVANTQNPKMTNEEIYELSSKLLGDFHLNREIHAELEYYAEHKTFLGEHPIFADWKKAQQQNEMTAAEIAQRIKNIGPAISKQKGKLKTANRQQKAEIHANIKKLEEERTELQKKLNEKQ